MGADYVIAVDLMPERTKAERPRNMMEVMVVTFYNMVRATSREGSLADRLIMPDIRDFGFAELGSRDALMARGRQAATKISPDLNRELRLGRVPLSERFLTFARAWMRTRRFIEAAILRRGITAIPAEVPKQNNGADRHART
jgi:hypothetical protein